MVDLENLRISKNSYNITITFTDGEIQNKNKFGEKKWNWQREKMQQKISVTLKTLTKEVCFDRKNN